MKSLIIILCFSVLGFVVGTLVGGNYDFTSFCLPNGCGYEAMGTIGLVLGFVVGLSLVLVTRKR